MSSLNITKSENLETADRKVIMIPSILTSIDIQKIKIGANGIYFPYHWK